MAKKKTENKEETALEETKETVETAEAEKPKKTKKKKEETETEEKKKSAKEKLLERAKQLGSEVKTEDLKEKLTNKTKDKEDTLVPIEDYVKCGIHIGTKVITPHLKPFVYRRRADGIAIINTNLIDDKLREAIDFFVKYDPKDVILVCKREAGWKAAEVFSEVTGIRVFTKKYPAGIITNSKLPNFFETELVIACDPWLDKNAMNDAKKTKKKIMALCDTNNYAFDVDVLIPCNNKSNKSIGLVLYLLAQAYIKARGIDKTLPALETFVGEKLD